MVVAPYIPAGRGHFVDVVREAQDIEVFGSTVFYRQAGQFGPSWVCTGAVPDEQGYVNTTLVIADNCLRPLRGPGDEVVSQEVRPLPREVAA